MNYDLSNIKMDISKCQENFNLINDVCGILEIMEGKEAADAFRLECLGKDDQTLLFRSLGGSVSFETALRAIVRKTGITLISTNGKLNISDDLYIIVE